MQIVSRATIFLGDIELEVFQLLDGSYRLSQTQVAKAIGKGESDVRSFLGSKSPLALPYKGFTSAKGKVNGERTTINLVPIEIVVAYWHKESLNGNILAVATMAACALEAINRRADRAFGKKTSEEEYNQKVAAIRDIGKRTRRRLTDSTKDYIQRNSIQNTPKLYRDMTASLNRILFGKSAAKIQEERGNIVTRDNLTFEELRDLENLENAAAALIDRNVHPYRAVVVAYKLVSGIGGLSTTP